MQRTRRRLAMLLAAAGAGVLAAGGSAGALSLRRVATVSNPTYVASPPGDSRLFVVEQAGRIRVRSGGRLRTYLDIRDRVGSGGERGLLSVAFHPRFHSNGRFFVNYTNRNGDTRIVSFRARHGRVIRGSGRVLLAIAQPYSNHNGGQIQFGPDGLLYIGMGDGGAGGDPENRAQNRRVLLGKMLRIDVDRRSRGLRYAVPAKNPFARRGGGRREIYALGVRNPWRFSFDRDTGDLWIADVGQSNWEEIDRVAKGTSGLLNLGWDALEGTHPFDPKPTSGRLVRPVYQYSHGSGGCSITGGYVYRGSAVPSLVGRYVWADYCEGVVHSLGLSGSGVRGLRDEARVDSPTSFGEDAAGELYVASQGGGIYKLVR